MTHKEHVELIQPGISQQGGVWADFGSGEGAFTLALRDILGSYGEIYTVDTNKESLDTQKELFRERFLNAKIHFIAGDFSKLLQLPKLDGVLAANSLHFVEDKKPVLQLWKSYLKPGGRLIVVEYNVDTGNAWVPYPFSYQAFSRVVQDAGFTSPAFLASAPSQFLTEMYSATAFS